jgi:N-hydroxyarylamine O-acetyltransferase
MQLADYFSRISYPSPAAPTAAALKDLVRAHVLNVPFENLDVQLGLPLTIAPEAAYEKIVDRNRGGWCYEQNGLLGWALAKIGFEVVRVAAAVRRSERGDVANANHLCLLVRPMDDHQTWLADVGFGGSMLAPIELEESLHSHAPFQLGLRRTADNHWQFWEDAGSGEFNYDFRAKAADENSLSARCEFLQTSPESSFVKSLIAQVRTPDSHKTLRGKVLSHTSSSGRHTGLLQSADELVEVLRDTFRLDVPDAGDLWPRIERRHEELLEEK